MSTTWRGAAPPDPPPMSTAGWARMILRAGLLLPLLAGGLAILLLLRLLERPLYGLHRPWTPQITVFVCACALRIIGLRYHRDGTPMTGPGAVVANHASWLDIFVLNARQRVYFVSKSDVAGWPGIGWLARATGTLFISRDRRDAAAQTALFEARLRAGHRLLFFPEGTSSDGQRVLPFKSTLFAAFCSGAHPAALGIQPVSVIYSAPEGTDPRFYGWWGDMGFGAHLLQVLAAPRRGRVRVIYHTVLPVRATVDRKSIARASEDAVRVGLETHLPRSAVTPEDP